MLQKDQEKIQMHLLLHKNSETATRTLQIMHDQSLRKGRSACLIVHLIKITALLLSATTSKRASIPLLSPQKMSFFQTEHFCCKTGMVASVSSEVVTRANENASLRMSTLRNLEVKNCSDLEYLRIQPQ